MSIQNQSEAGPSTARLSSPSLNPPTSDQLQLESEAESEPKISKAKTKALAKAARKAEYQAQRAAAAATQAAHCKGKNKKPIPVPVTVGVFDNPAEEEERTVHEVYDAIAPHFSQTRHKPWPLITSFLHSLPANSIGLDSGAGNGKYLHVLRDRNAGIEMIALDRSRGLLDIAKAEAGGECVRGDLGFGGWRDGVFDFTISVAAIHHLSTHERRRHAVQALLKPLRLSAKPPYSRFMIYVWAYEQGEASRRKMGSAAGASAASAKDGRRCRSDEQATTNDTAGGGSTEVPHGTQVDGEADSEERERVQDVLVPWVMKRPKSTLNPGISAKVKSKEEAEASPASARPTEEEGAEGEEEENKGEGEQGEEEKVYHRYYHLFLAGELRRLVQEAATLSGFRIVQSDTDAERDGIIPQEGEGAGAGAWIKVRAEGWEMDNWWLEGEVGTSG